MQSRSQRKIINVVLISFHRSLRVCTLNGLQALHATLLHSECNVATDRMVCSILCLMLHALTRSRPQDQLPFSFCLQNCMSVARFLGLCDHMHRFLSKFCCLKRSLGEAALCYILRHELWMEGNSHSALLRCAAVRGRPAGASGKWRHARCTHSAEPSVIDIISPARRPPWDRRASTIRC